MNKEEFVWEHFKLNAEQRLQGFNFFVVFAIFANGGVFAAFEKQLTPVLITILGAFISLISLVFFLVDTRSRDLLHLTIPALIEIENNFPETHKLFSIDKVNQRNIFRYTTAIRVLLGAEFVFGIGIMIFGLVKWLC
jgi:hypothetical protein